MIHIYTDGACIGNPGSGGWAAVIEEEGVKRALAGREDDTTNNRMEILAAIKGIEATPKRSEATVFSDSQYLVNTMNKGWKRNANQDLWAWLDAVVKSRRVKWEWVRGHAGHPENEEADRLANQEARLGVQEAETENEPGPAVSRRLTHLDEEGRARQVDVGDKEVTRREAVARGSVVMQPETLSLIKQGLVEKGDVLGVARLAGVMGAKLTPQLIPLTHAIPLDQVVVELDLDEADSAVRIQATARATARTGVEMEALTAVLTAALTIYDMCKAVDRGMRIQDVRLVRKTGGQSGDIILEQ